MKRFPQLLVVINLLFTPAALPAADPPSQPPKEQQVVKITLHPMAETRPGLKYQLLPPFLDRHPGNAAVRWNRLSADECAFLTEFTKPGGIWDKTEKWMAIPIGDPREKEFRSKDAAFSRSLKDIGGFCANMDYAARFESCDWELPIHEGHAYAILLPEVQESRTWGRMLAAKVHGEIIDKKYNSAVQTFQTGLMLARHEACGQTLVHGMAGLSIASLMTQQIEQFIQQLDAPNLYWALAALPRPLLDFRPGYEFEMNAVALNFADLQGLERKKLSEEQWNELLKSFLRDMERVNTMVISPVQTDQLTAAMKMVQGYPRARQYLIDGGRKKTEVEAMCPSQVVLLYTIGYYEELRDDLFKAMFLPYPEAKDRIERMDTKRRDGFQKEIIPLASMLLPSISSVKDSETRMPWIIARLRIFEALRIYAAAHNGQLPERLSDISEVPIPANPYDDKPFIYHRDGNRAILDCESGPRNHNMPWRCEITMVSKAKN